jgi:hypothetical protein
MEVPVDTLTATELVAGIEEIKHQIVHLKRSQVELRDFILEDPDPEFVQAVEENEAVLVRKNASLMRFIEALRLLDASTAAHYQSSLIDKASQGDAVDCDGAACATAAHEEGARAGAAAPRSAPVPDSFDGEAASVPTQGIFL